MRFSLRPDRVFDGYEQIEGQELARRGIRLLLCDLDYTLAPKSQREPDETVRRWIGQMRLTTAVLPEWSSSAASWASPTRDTPKSHEP